MAEGTGGVQPKKLQEAVHLDHYGNRCGEMRKWDERLCGKGIYRTWAGPNMRAGRERK